MGRIFSSITIVIILTMTLTASGIFYLSQANDNKIKHEAVVGLTKGISQSISTRTQLLCQSLANIAQSPELIEALQQADLPRAKALVQLMSVYLPDALAFRLLLPDDTKPDDAIIPHMGYADLDLVKNTFQQPQLPLIQGEQGSEHRHLAITQGILQDGQVIAVILASVDFQDLQQSFNVFKGEPVFIELKQANFVLFSQGKAEIKSTGNNASLKVKDTAWTVSYWYQDSINLTLLYQIFAMVLFAIILSGLACYIGFRKLHALLVHDQNSLLKVTKDLMVGNADGNYPVKLQVMNNYISSIIQFKREKKVINNNELISIDDTPFLSTQVAGIEVKDVESEEVKDIIALPAFSKKPSSNEAKIEPTLSSLPSRDKPIKTLAKKTSPTDVIFRAYDIRGIVDKTLTNDIVYDIGRALGSEAFDKGIKTIVTAKDGRLSSPDLSKVLAEGILSTGTNILDIGTVPTPVLYFVAHHHDSHSGVMLTGSHNPADYNGLKIVLEGETLSGEAIQNLKNRIDSGNLHDNSPGKLTENSMFTSEYIGVITEDIRIARPMKVVVDAGNGVAGELAPVLLRTLGCEVIELYCNIDGTFPNHHPDPSKPKNLLDLIAAVEEHQADVGLAFDGDGDRLGVIDSHGNIIWPDRQMMLFSKYILAKKPGAEIIYDLNPASPYFDSH
ncbi:phosphomannomutase/phosphoglucomutase [Methyloprofundus sp.]|uniref:phosphomannomutase/phosphoglucomutase n=1 Tax=Methyloprofundus sp. TaxID=2020875 RepID=UPI003D0EC4B5